MSNLPDSRAALQISLALSGLDMVPHAVPAHQYLQSFEVIVASGGAWTGVVVLFDPAGAFLEKLLFSLGNRRFVHLGWQWEDAVGGAGQLYMGQITKVTPTFAQEGVTLQLDVCQMSAVAQALDKDAKPRSWKAGKTATAILRDIITRRKWRVVDGNKKSTVEESHGALDELVMGKESDIGFINTVLLPQAVDKDGNKFTFGLTPDGAVHFHTAAYYDRGLAAKYTFARSMMGDVISFTVSDEKVFASMYAGGKAIFNAVDSKEGQRTEVPTEEKSGVPGSSQDKLRDEAYFQSVGDDVAAKVAILARTQAELERYVATRFQAAREVAYRATLEVRGAHAVLPFDVIDVDYIMSDGKPHYLSGQFRVQKVTHNVDTGGWKTTFDLVRSGTKRATPEDSKHEAGRVQDPEVTDATLGVDRATVQKAVGKTKGVVVTVTRPVIDVSR